ncbi:alpha/beta fold hydrolase [Janthinobacterium fluminis]|uniref:Alpha/beta hydrolase n=1 Tax=Janthinobacterium fluminis TaxID=2987524 RepID=A0ABT5K1T6_9BURK|nr:alpha/beta hydrolase [Janthinobacterium fluminis]MDC8758948.1 alpha/beta hydrolase [Janthinobacterium fluminis]
MNMPLRLDGAARRQVTREVAGYPIRATYHGECAQPRATWLFVHGMVESDDVWASVPPLLPPGVVAVTLELPWSGRLDALWGLSMAPEQWLHAALEAHGIAPDGIVAHSFGANVVLQYLERHGSGGVAHLLLISPFYKASTGDVSWELFQHYVFEFERFIELSLTVRQGSRPLAPELFGAVRQKLRDQFGCYSWMQFWQLFSRTPFLSLREFTQPCLLITGADDFSSPLADVTALARGLPDARLVVFEDCSHFCLSSKRQETLAQIVDFVDMSLPAPFSTSPTHRSTHDARSSHT